MKLSLNLLRKIINIREERLDHTLSMIGHEVDYVTEFDKKNIVIGKIIDYSRHPNSNKLSYCKVDIGNDLLDIVCGAKNHKLNDRVVVAKVSSKIGDMEIVEREIRGVVSKGMICSAGELGFKDEVDGVLVLDDKSPIGENAYRYLVENDTVFDLAITPNRSDLLSHLGVARELGAYCEVDLDLSFTNREKDVYVKFSNVGFKACSLYRAIEIKGVDVKESPEWLKRHLRSLGAKSINNIVDISNYVMFELGHPTHMFDRSKIEGKLRVRLAKDGERVTGLDDVEYTLSSDDLVIVDSEKIVAIAGVIGAKNSCVEYKTKDVILEIAHFDKAFVRKTSKRLGLSTEASYRFERAVDIEDSEMILNRILNLLEDSSGFTSFKEILSHKIESKEKKICFSFSHMNKFLGTEISIKETTNILKYLSMRPEIDESNQDLITVTLPSYRMDISREVCIYEEVARMYGYENIEERLPKIESTLRGYKNSSDTLRDTLISFGLNEIITYSFVPKEYGEVKIDNPLNEGFAVMRSSFIYSMLKTTLFNINNGVKDIKIFEIGKIYSNEREIDRLAIAMSGVVEKDLWDSKRNLDFYDLKGIIDKLGDLYNVNFTFHKSEETFLHPYISLDIFLGEQKVGHMGAIHPKKLDEFDIKRDIFFLEMDIFDRESREIRDVSKFPRVERELSLEFDRSIEIGSALNQLCNDPLILNYSVLDIYTGDKISKDLKSVAFKFIISSGEKTLTDDEINRVVDTLLERAEKNFKAKLRGF